MAGQQENLTAARETQTTDDRQRRKIKAARLSILSNATLVVLKIGVGLWSGSVGVLSEAVHSASDLIASGIAFFSVRVSDTPPDARHPYGHGKIESLSSLAEALLIFVAAIYIVIESMRRLLDPAQSAPRLEAGLVVMAVSSLANVFLSRYLRRVAHETDSQALHADAEHLRTDVLTSLGVLAGLALARLTGDNRLDPLAALVVAVVIFHAAYVLCRDAIHPLLDARLPAEEEAAIQEILETDPRVLSYHKLRTRKSGSRRDVDVHVQIDDDCSLVQAHALTEELEDKIRAVLPSISINIHMEPYHAEMRHQMEAHGVTVPPEAASVLAKLEDNATHPIQPPDNPMETLCDVGETAPRADRFTAPTSPRSYSTSKHTRAN